eukprot:125841-Chlamydomonas_euryale.AAC.10
MPASCTLPRGTPAAGRCSCVRAPPPGSSQNAFPSMPPRVSQHTSSSNVDPGGGGAATAPAADNCSSAEQNPERSASAEKDRPTSTSARTCASTDGPCPPPPPPGPLPPPSTLSLELGRRMSNTVRSTGAPSAPNTTSASSRALPAWIRSWTAGAAGVKALDEALLG